MALKDFLTRVEKLRRIKPRTLGQASRIVASILLESSNYGVFEGKGQEV